MWLVVVDVAAPIGTRGSNGDGRALTGDQSDASTEISCRAPVEKARFLCTVGGGECNERGQAACSLDGAHMQVRVHGRPVSRLLLYSTVQALLKVYCKPADTSDHTV